jgi:hypothetical protein
MTGADPAVFREVQSPAEIVEVRCGTLVRQP